MSYFQLPYNLGLVFSDTRALQRAAWQVYQHRHVGLLHELIDYRFDTENAATYKQFLNPVQNPLRRCAQLLSVTYTVPTYRTAGNPETDRAVKKHVSALDAALEKGEEYKNACGDSAILPYWSERLDAVDFHVIPPTTIDDLAVDESGDAKHFDIGKTRYHIDGTFQQMGDADWGEKIDNGLGGLCSVIWFRADPHAEEIWSAECVRDLVLGTLEIGISEAMNNSGEFFRSFKQLFLLHPNSGGVRKTAEEMKSIRPGPNFAMRDPIGVADLGDPKNPQYDSIRKKIADLAATRGISDSAYFSTVEQPVFSPELRARWRKSVKYQLEPERQLMRVCVALINKWKKMNLKITDDQYQIDYQEPIPELADPMQRLKILDAGMRLGVDDPVLYLLRNNQEIVTDEQAMDFIKKSAETRAAVIELAVERNEPRDPDDADGTRTPQENGSIGGQISAELRGEYDGARGPRKTPEDFS